MGLAPTFVGDRLIDRFGAECHRPQMLGDEALQLTLGMGDDISEAQVSMGKSEEPDLCRVRRGVSRPVPI